MGINDNFWSLSSYRVNEIPRVSFETENVAPVVEDDRPANAASISIEPVVDNRPRNILSFPLNLNLLNEKAARKKKLDITV